MGCLVILIGIAAVWGEQQPTYYPAFTMVREVTRGDSRKVYQFVYEENGAWRETVVSSTPRTERRWVVPGRGGKSHSGTVVL